MSRIELHELSPVNLLLNPFGDGWCRDIVFCADHNQGGNVDTRELSMRVELRHRCQGLADNGGIPGRDTVHKRLVDFRISAWRKAFDDHILRYFAVVARRANRRNVM